MIKLDKKMKTIMLLHLFNKLNEVFILTKIKEVLAILLEDFIHSLDFSLMPACE